MAALEYILIGFGFIFFIILMLFAVPAFPAAESEVTDPAPGPGFAPPSLRSPIAPSSQLPTGVGSCAAGVSLFLMNTHEKHCGLARPLVARQSCGSSRTDPLIFFFALDEFYRLLVMRKASMVRSSFCSAPSRNWSVSALRASMMSRVL